MQQARNTIAVIVLAGGEGRRIGGGKPLRLLGGEPLVERALRIAHRFSDQIALSVGSEDQVPDYGVPQIVDPEPGWGALGGLAAGLAFAGRNGLDLILTLPCDSPFLPDDLLSRLAAALHPGKGAAIPRSSGHLHLACGLWRVGIADRVLDYGKGGGRSLHGLIERIGFTEAEWPADPIDPFFNVNSPDDLDRAETMLAMI